ncbi:MAG: hypothetical protein ACRDD4_00115 [Culicoidibacterales bacterium]
MKKLRTVLGYYPNDIWFIVASFLIPAVYGLINRYFIGYMGFDSIIVDQSYEALEVLGEVFLEMLPLAFLAIVAQNFRNQQTVKKTLASTVIMQLVFTISFALISILFAGNFVDFINTPASVQTLAVPYFQLKACVLPFQSLALIFTLGIKSVYGGKKAIAITCIGVVLNFLFDAIFISNYTFSLQLGLIGSGLSAIISQAFFAMIAGVILLKAIDFKREDWQFKRQATLTRQLIKIGKFNGAESLVRNLGYIIGVVAVVNTLTGTIEIVAFNTLQSIFWGIVLVPVLAFGEATNITMAKLIGSQKMNEAITVMKISGCIVSGWLMTWIVIGNFVIIDVATWLNGGAIYSVGEQTLIQNGFIVLGIAYLFFGLTTIVQSYFIATGQPKWMLYTSAIINLAIYIPFGMICKYSGVQINFAELLQSYVIIYALNFMIVAMFYLKNRQQEIQPILQTEY